MIGPHYERLAEIEQRMTAKQMLEKMKNRPENPLSRVLDKLKKEYSQYETAYSDPIMDYQISALDRILSFDSKLGPVLDSLQKQNLLLRKELGVLEGQLSNTVGICEQILAQNNELKLIIKKKNEDIAKIIDTIAHNQAQQLTETEQKNMLLLKENSILMTHLEQIKKQHEKYVAAFSEHEEEREKLENRVAELKKQLTDSTVRQRELSRKVSLLEQSMYQNSEELYHLRQDKESLTFQNNELKNQVLLLKDKGEGSNYETIRKHMEAEFQPIIEEHRLLKKERTQLLRESEKLKLEKEKLEDLQSQLERQVYKSNGDLEMTTSLLNEQKNKNAGLNTSLAKLQAKLNEIKEENNRLKAEKETSGNYALTREKRLLQEIDDLRRSLDDKQGEVEARIREISKSMQGLLESKENQLGNLREENLQLQRMLERRS